MPPTKTDTPVLVQCPLCPARFTVPVPANMPALSVPCPKCHRWTKAIPGRDAPEPPKPPKPLKKKVPDAPAG